MGIIWDDVNLNTSGLDWFQWAPLMMTMMILRIKWRWIVTYFMLHREVINIMW